MIPCKSYFNSVSSMSLSPLCTRGNRPSGRSTSLGAEALREWRSRAWNPGHTDLNAYILPITPHFLAYSYHSRCNSHATIPSINRALNSIINNWLCVGKPFPHYSIWQLFAYISHLQKWPTLDQNPILVCLYVCQSPWCTFVTCSL